MASRFDRRVLAVSGVMITLFALVWVRFLFVQVIDGGRMSELDAAQSTRKIRVNGTRGPIIDAFGRTLAMSVPASTLYFQGDRARPSTELTAVLEGEMGVPESQVDRMMRRTFSYIGRDRSPEAANQVMRRGLDGIGVLDDSQRIYPYGELTSHILGFVGVDEVGLAGLEDRYESSLKAESRDLLVNIWWPAEAQKAEKLARSLDGSPLRLGLTVERLKHDRAALDRAIGQSDAEGGSVVVVDLHTGQVLSAVELPTFNPAMFAATDPARLNTNMASTWFTQEGMGWDWWPKSTFTGEPTGFEPTAPEPGAFIDFPTIDADSERAVRTASGTQADGTPGVARYWTPLRVVAGTARTLSQGRISKLWFQANEDAARSDRIQQPIPSGGVIAVGRLAGLDSRKGTRDSTIAMCWGDVGTRSVLVACFLYDTDSELSARTLARSCMAAYRHEFAE